MNRRLISLLTDAVFGGKALTRDQIMMFCLTLLRVRSAKAGSIAWDWDEWCLLTQRFRWM